MFRVLDWMGIDFFSGKLMVLLQIIFLPVNSVFFILRQLEILPTYTKFYTYSFPIEDNTYPYCGLYMVSESGTIEPSKKVDTLRTMPLVPGGPIIIPSCC